MSEDAFDPEIHAMDALCARIEELEAERDQHRAQGNDLAARLIEMTNKLEAAYARIAALEAERADSEEREKKWLELIAEFEEDGDKFRARVAALEAERDAAREMLAGLADNPGFFQTAAKLATANERIAELEAAAQEMMDAAKRMMDAGDVAGKRIAALEEQARARIAALEAERDRLRGALEGLLCLTPSAYERRFEAIHRQLRTALAGEEKP